MDVKVVGESFMGKRICTKSPEYPPQIIYCMGEVVTFTLDKTGRYDLNQIIKADIIDMGTRGYLVSASRMRHEGHNSTLVFLPKMCNLNLIMRKH